MEKVETNVSFILMYDPSKNSSLDSANYQIVRLKNLVSFSSYVLLVLDFFAIYVPQFWLERFHYFQNILPNDEKQWGESPLFFQQESLKILDISHDLHACLCKTDTMIDFSLLPECIFRLLEGSSWTFISMKQRKLIRFILPFVEFLAPCSNEVEYWRKKARGSFVLADLDI